MPWGLLLLLWTLQYVKSDVKDPNLFPINKKVPLTSTVVLRCSLDGQPEPVAMHYWMDKFGKNTAICSCEGRSGFNASHAQPCRWTDVQATYEQIGESYFCILTIKRVTMKHSGQWNCETVPPGLSSLNHGKTSTNLTVFEPLHDLVLSSSGRHFLSANTIHNFTCSCNFTCPLVPYLYIDLGGFIMEQKDDFQTICESGEVMETTVTISASLLLRKEDNLKLLHCKAGYFEIDTNIVRQMRIYMANLSPVNVSILSIFSMLSYLLSISHLIPAVMP